MYYNKIKHQFHAIFGIFMVVFYIGFGIFFLFYSQRWFTIDRALSVIIGSAFSLLGIYRIFLSYKQIKEAFSADNEDSDD